VFWIQLHNAIHAFRRTHTLRFPDETLAPLHRTICMPDPRAQPFSE
jgi:hypothetical protein